MKIFGTHVYFTNPDGCITKKLKKPESWAIGSDGASSSGRAILPTAGPKRFIPGLYVGQKSRLRTLEKEWDAWAKAGGPHDGDRMEAVRRLKDWLKRIKANQSPFNDTLFKDEWDIRLRLNHLGLTSLPKLPPNVEELALTGNKLKTFPPQILKLERLSMLLLSHNQLEELPDEIANLPRLKCLGLRNNKIKALPATFMNLNKDMLLDLYSYGWPLSFLRGNPVYHDAVVAFGQSDVWRRHSDIMRERMANAKMLSDSAGWNPI